MTSFPAQRTIGFLALLCPFWFASVYLVLSGIRPEYSHLTKAISELGSVDAPRAALWNILGYFTSGIVIALLGLGVKREFRADSRSHLPSYALMASGAFMAMSGVFPGDFENRSSMTMLLHTVGSIMCFVAFLVAGFTFPRVMKHTARFRAAVWPSIVLVCASIIAGFLRSGEMPGLGQRLGFFFYFLWIGLVGFMLYRYTRLSNQA